MNKVNVKQHVVPQSYLRRFAKKNKNNKGYHIGVRRHDKNDILLFVKAIDDIAYVDNYYDVSVRDDPKHWERYFSREIEPLYGTSLGNIISKAVLTMPDHRVLCDNDKHILAELISFQFLRVPAFLNHHIERGVEFGQKLKKQIIQLFEHRISKDQIDNLNNLTIDSDLVKDITFDAISDSERLTEFAKILEDRIWTIDCNNTVIPFITSDNPVILYNFINGTADYKSSGIGRQDTIILFPLSSRHLLQIFPKELLGKTGIKIDGSMIAINKKDIKFVIGVNMLQIQHASKEAYMDPKFLEEIKAYDRVL